MSKKLHQHSFRWNSILRQKVCKFWQNWNINKLPLFLKYTLTYTITLKYQKIHYKYNNNKNLKLVCPLFPGTFTQQRRQNCRTQRFERSPIPVMTRLLSWHPPLAWHCWYCPAYIAAMIYNYVLIVSTLWWLIIVCEYFALANCCSHSDMSPE